MTKHRLATTVVTYSVLAVFLLCTVVFRGPAVAVMFWATFGGLSVGGAVKVWRSERRTRK